MAELKLSTVWLIKDFAEQNARIKKENHEYISEELLQLAHASLQGLKWKAILYTAPADEFYCSKGFAGLYLYAQFGDCVTDAKYVWANYTATLLDADGLEMAKCVILTKEFTSQEGDGKYNGRGSGYSFRMADINKAVRKDGSLRFRIELTVVHTGEVLKCRDLLRGLLANETMTDFNVKVGKETFKLHKSIMAETSAVFARMFESGMKEVEDGVLPLPDTTSAAFKAFRLAMYFDNWNFLSDVDLTQEVLHLAEKYNVGNLMRYCDDALAESVNETNALEILTKSAAVCNAVKTKAACVAYLADHAEFRETQVWLDFKKRCRGVALEILEDVHEKVTARVKTLEHEQRERDATIADLKRKCKDENERASSSKRCRK